MTPHEIKNKILYPVWICWRNFERSRREISGTCYIVMGGHRSGTSLVSGLVEACGVYWGESGDLKSADLRNPAGFLEHDEFFYLSRRFLDEARYGTENDVHLNLDLRAKGIKGKLSRFLTRTRMLNLLKKFSRGKDKWGFKMFPIFLYFWKNYIPSPKIVGVFREPVSAAHSIVNFHIGGRYTFEQALGFWNNSNRHLLYHLAVNDGILIKYEDLFDPGRRDKILSALVSFVGGGEVEYLRVMVDRALNRSGRKTEVLRKNYPLKPEIKETLAALEKLKI